MKIINETVSGWKHLNRSKLDKVYEYCKANPNFINYVLYQKTDRFYRNTSQAWDTINKFKKIGVEVNFVEQWINYEAPGSHLHLNIYLGLAVEESRNTSMRVKQNLITVKKAGFYIAARSPRGYMKIRIENRYSLINDGSGTLDIIRTIFDGYLKGLGARMVFFRKFQKQLGIQRTQFYRMFSVIAYAGYNQIKSEKEDLKYIKAKWEGIISLQQFIKIQDLLALEEKGSNRSTFVNLELFWLKNCLLCSDTGQRMTASYSKGKKKHYAYYHNQFNTGQRIAVWKAHLIVKNIISRIKLQRSEFIMEAIAQKVNDFFSEKDKKVNSQIANVEKSIKEVNHRMESIKDLLTTMTITIDEYRDLKNHLSKRLIKHHEALENFHKSKDYIKFDIKLLRKKILSEFKNFENNNFLQKNRLLNCLFPDGFKIIEEYLEGTFNLGLLPFLEEESLSKIKFDKDVYGRQDQTIIEHHFKLIQNLVA